MNDKIYLATFDSTPLIGEDLADLGYTVARQVQRSGMAGLEQRINGGYVKPVRDAALDPSASAFEIREKGAAFAVFYSVDDQDSFTVLGIKRFGSRQQKANAIASVNERVSMVSDQRYGSVHASTFDPIAGAAKAVSSRSGDFLTDTAAALEAAVSAGPQVDEPSSAKDHHSEGPDLGATQKALSQPGARSAMAAAIGVQPTANGPVTIDVSTYAWPQLDMVQSRRQMPLYLDEAARRQIEELATEHSTYKTHVMRVLAEYALVSFIQAPMNAKPAVRSDVGSGFAPQLKFDVGLLEASCIVRASNMCATEVGKVVTTWVLEGLEKVNSGQITFPDAEKVRATVTEKKLTQFAGDVDLGQNRWKRNHHNSGERSPQQPRITSNTAAALGPLQPSTSPISALIRRQRAYSQAIQSKAEGIRELVTEVEESVDKAAATRLCLAEVRTTATEAQLILLAQESKANDQAAVDKSDSSKASTLRAAQDIARLASRRETVKSVIKQRALAATTEDDTPLRSQEAEGAKRLIFEEMEATQQSAKQLFAPRVDDSMGL